MLDTVRRLHELGVWIEIVTLLIPGFNDSDAELERLTAFVAGVSSEIPWHITAFHADYKMTDRHDTSVDMLLRAAVGRENGLRFVYAGNRAGQVGDLEHTCCPTCGTAVVERHGYHVQAYRLTAAGACQACRAPIPGR